MVTAVIRMLPALVFLAALLPVTPAHAGVVIAGTRVVYPAQEKEVTLGLNNEAEVSRSRAIELWPTQSDFFKRKMDHSRAEAALIAEWGRRVSR